MCSTNTIVSPYPAHQGVLSGANYNNGPVPFQHNMPRFLTISSKERKALNEVVSYLQDDEEKSYESEDRPKNHIYNSIVVLQNLIAYVDKK